MTISPAMSRSASSRHDKCRQSSTAKRCDALKRATQVTSSQAPSEVAGTVTLPSSRPTSSAATAVCVRLSASIPTITMVRTPSFHQRVGHGPVGGHTTVEASYIARLLSSHAGRSGAVQGAGTSQGSHTEAGRQNMSHAPRTRRA